MIYASVSHMSKIAPIVHNAKERYKDKPSNYKNGDKAYGRLHDFIY